jgi:signal transduction histidine kinase
VLRASEDATELVLALTPTGRDAEMIHDRVVADGFPCRVCPELQSLLDAISAGGGPALVAHEALTPEGAERLLATLGAQDPWSDVPVLFLLPESKPRNRTRSARLGSDARFFERANVTLLQRPLDLQLFSSSVRSAVRARRRQFQMRDLHRELERAVQLSDLFVSILGHDLRDPINAIKLGAEIIVRLSPDAHALRPAGRILTAADRMTRLIEQLLDFARARRGGGIPIQVGHMNLAELCRHTVDELLDSYPEARVDFVELGEVSGTWDPDRLAQVVSNLLRNALQHGTRGMPITLAADGTDPASVRLRVENFGSIPPEALPTLFEAFARPDVAQPNGPAAPKRSGLGLGLFIAREVARAHDGSISVESAGDRIKFEVTLPREARAAID